MESTSSFCKTQAEPNEPFHSNCNAKFFPSVHTYVRVFNLANCESRLFGCVNRMKRRFIGKFQPQQTSCFILGVPVLISRESNKNRSVNDSFRSFLAKGTKRQKQQNKGTSTT